LFAWQAQHGTHIDEGNMRPPTAWNGIMSAFLVSRSMGEWHSGGIDGFAMKTAYKVIANPINRIEMT
jgi:hypothetical protein